MNSPFANLFLAIRKQIIDNVTSIVHIDQDLGQLSGKNAAMRPPVNFPCVLIDFEDFNFTNLANNVQASVGTVVLKLCFAPYSNSTQATPKTYLNNAISFYDIEYTLHLAMQGWTPAGDEYGSLNRIKASTQKNTDIYRVREIRYNIAFDDYSTKPGLTNHAATLVITEEFVV